MEFLDLIRTFGALAVVIGLMVGAMYALRRWGGGWLPVAPAGQARRLSVVEQLAIDPKRRLVLVRRDSREHLLLLTAEGAIVVEAGHDA
ncbi:flagellar biosynthetic protein FliO [Bradyrhizobium sp.]|uniref:FliO/MopB family protein n=1 Tax=Bradyrhizobium sp. TaxID=376 RepID=UPI0025BD0373|nr:flagellar biosynthetic protein FliO [Bradyrhizobium sp.]MCA3255407.1 FliO/MopB family protein [Alphaproteobacteria bacterium]MCA3569239.1 FliO/MopB family protein [Bradyrhizobium sp.]